jgi:hypothetical protein
MDGHDKRLGDLIDDYCPRCRHLLNHAVASMVGTQVAKVICQTCYSEHPFRHGDAGKKKSDPRATLFDQVLGKVSASDVEDEPIETPAEEKPPSARRTPAAKRKPARGKARL